jgi:hypothetical protein
MATPTDADLQMQRYNNQSTTGAVAATKAASGDRGSGRRQRGSRRQQRTEEEADTEAATEAAAATAVTEAAAEAAAATKAAEATAEATRWQRSSVVAEGGSGRGAVWWQRGQSSKVVTG